MPTLVLVRHGRTTANASGILAGRSPGVELDEKGRDQVVSTGQRLAAVPLVAVVSSPMERCRQTADALVAAQPSPIDVVVEPGLDECDYGQWQGRPLKELAAEDLWKVVQSKPSQVLFPDGEAMTEMQRRGVEAVRRVDAEVREQHGEHAVWAAVSHGDVIKSILADALGMDLDLFQRLSVDPASVSVIRYGTDAIAVPAVNTHAGDLAWLSTKPDQSVGGGAGPAGRS